MKRYKHILRVFGLLIVIPFTLFVVTPYILISSIISSDWKSVIALPLDYLNMIEYYLETGDLG